jgi:Transposase DDE domain
MERELWESLCRLAGLLYNREGHSYYGDDVIVAVLWWAAVHDRPVSWACEAAHWPPDLTARPLPSQPTVSRRLRSRSVELLMHSVEQTLLALSGAVGCWVRSIDGKPLVVGGPSKDPDAAWGRASGGTQKGYKLHAVWGWGPLPIAWALGPLNVSERRVALQLVKDLPGEGYLLGDRQYDSEALYEAAAAAGYQLVAPRQRTGRALGHRRQNPHRLRSLALLATPFGRALYRCRICIEHCFAKLTSFVGGLAPLPFWVRRFHRVRLWVQSKLLLNAVHCLKFPPKVATATE